MKTRVFFLVIFFSFLYFLKPSLENFISLKKNPINLDFHEIFSVLTTNIISKSPNPLPNLIGFTTKTNITSTSTNRLSTVNFIIDDILKKINNNNISHVGTGKIEWKLLELIKFDVKLSEKSTMTSNLSNSYFIELFLIYSDTPIQLVVILDYDEYTKQIHYNKVILLNKIKQFKNAYDPFSDNSFKIENSLGLLPPFKSSNTTIL
jgi:hypothetical protein